MDQVKSNSPIIRTSQEVLNEMVKVNMMPNYVGLKTNLGIEYFKVGVEKGDGDSDGVTTLTKTTPLNLGKEFMVYDYGNDHAESPIKKQSVEDITAQYQNPAYDQSYYDSLKDSMSDGEWARLQGSYGEITDSMDFNMSDNTTLVDEVGRKEIEDAKNKCK